MPACRAVVLGICSASMLAFPVHGQSRVTRKAEKAVPVIVPLPITDATMCSVAIAWSRSVHIPVGVECLRQPSEPTPSPDHVSRYLDLTGVAAEEGLRELVGHSPFAARLMEDFAVIRPRDPGPNAFLDTKVPAFVATAASLDDVAQSIHRLFDPSYRPIPHVGGAFAKKPRGTHNIDVRLVEPTIEMILTTTCRQYGDMLSWRIVYLSPDRDPKRCVVEFVGADFVINAGPNHT